MPNANFLIVLLCFMMILLIFVAILFFVFTFFRPWMKAFVSGVPIPLAGLIGMKIRRSNIQQILEQGIAAAQAGQPISWPDLERAWLQKVDLEKVTLAYVTSQQRNLGFTFPELVAAEQEGKLAKLLQQ